jgi:hypothetical protein
MSTKIHCATNAACNPRGHSSREARDAVRPEADSMNDPGSRKRGGVRSCFNRNGAPKAAFATKKLAERAIPATSKGLRPYACAQHGWHLGHGTS